MASLSLTVLATATPTAKLYSSPKAIGRRANPRNPNPKRRSPRKKNNREPQTAKYKPPRQPIIGGEATTYTCLPPLDEEEDGDDLVFGLSRLPLEVKLSDFYVAAEKKSYRVLEEDRPLESKLSNFAVPAEEKLDDGVESYRLLEEEEEEGDEYEGEDEEDYGRYEVFEVGSDSEEEEEEEEEDENQEEGELVAGVGYRVGEVFEAGGVEDFEDGSEEDKNWEEGEVVAGLGFRVGEVFEGGSEEEIESGNGVIMGDIIVERRNWEEEEEGEEVNGEDKDKGVPAVMRCFDRAKIFVKGGNGGNGVVAFRREKFVPLGGPSGGDGGRGGNVYMEVDTAMNSLLPFRNQVHFRAGRGSHGQGSQMGGAKGEDVIVKVAPGTVVREAGKEEVLLELIRPGQRALLLPGGRGGRGNASFKSSGNKAPRIAENGEEGPELWLDLELKLVADVGIVGAPNAGKSTLLSVICAAQPTIANYPFTTLLPNLGVVSFDYDSTMVVADLPGLLEGAHRGFGLGHEFLRHSERCSALVHVVDGSSEQPELEFDAVRLEIELFSPELEEKPYVVAFNKMDLPDAYEKWPSFKENLEARGIKTFCMSAVKREGTHDVICAAYELLRKSKEAMEGIEDDVGSTDSEILNHVADRVKQQRRAPIDDFEISYDKTSMAWHVNGSGLQRFVQMTNWRYVDSDKRFQNVLEACGVTKSLKKMGVKEGDTVLVGEMELVWHDSPGTSSKMKKRSESTKWSDWKP